MHLKQSDNNAICQEQSILIILFLQEMAVASVVTSLLFSNVHGYEAEMESRQFTVGYVHILTRKWFTVV